VSADLERLIDRALRVQAVPAPTFAEAARAELMRAELASVGLADIEIDAVGNVYARLPGGGNPPIVVSAHLDSVFPAEAHVPARRIGGRVTGPGIGDNAIALAALVEVGLCAPADLPGDLWLVADVCEEGLGNLRGMTAVLERFGDTPLAYIVLEGMSFGQVYHRSLPSRRYRISTHAPGGHSWLHAGRPSAVHVLIQIGASLLSIGLPEKPRAALNIGRVEGGIGVNTIAPEAHMEVDLRCEATETLEALAAHLEDTVQERAWPEVEIGLECIGTRPGGAIPADHPLVAAAVRALRETGGIQARLEVGSTDASVPLSRGLPAVCVGLTRGTRAHCLDESIELEPLGRGLASLLSLIRAVFEIPESNRP
jgi:tripeptide aminopeptidase